MSIQSHVKFPSIPPFDSTWLQQTQCLSAASQHPKYIYIYINTSKHIQTLKTTRAHEVGTFYSQSDPPCTPQLP